MIQETGLLSQYVSLMNHQLQLISEKIHGKR